MFGSNGDNRVTIASVNSDPAKSLQDRVPTRIKVGYRDIRISWVPKEDVRSDHSGDTNFMRGFIRIDPSYGMQEAANTLLHETLHCAWRIAGLNDHEGYAEREEAAVNALANQLMQVFRDHPELPEWLIEAARAE